MPRLASGPRTNVPSALGHTPVKQRQLFRAKGGGVRAQLFEAAKAAIAGDKYKDTLNKLNAFTKKRKKKLKKSSHKFDWFHEGRLLNQRQDDVEKELDAFYARWGDVHGCERGDDTSKVAEEATVAVPNDGDGPDGRISQPPPQPSPDNGQDSPQGDDGDSNQSLLAKLQAKYRQPSAAEPTGTETTDCSPDGSQNAEVGGDRAQQSHSHEAAMDSVEPEADNRTRLQGQEAETDSTADVQAETEANTETATAAHSHEEGSEQLQHRSAQSKESFKREAAQLVFEYQSMKRNFHSDRQQTMAQVRASKGLALHLQQISDDPEGDEYQQVCSMLDQILIDFGEASQQRLRYLQTQEKIYAGEILRLSAAYRQGNANRGAATDAATEKGEQALMAEIQSLLAEGANADLDDPTSVQGEQIMVEFHDLNSVFQRQLDEIDGQIQQLKARRAGTGAAEPSLNSPAGVEGAAWDARDHGTYIKLFKHHVATGTSRAQLIERLQLALPSRTIQDIQAHHELCDSLRIAHAKKKDKLVAWRRAKHTKLTAIRDALVQKQKFAANAQQLAAAKQARAEARRKRAAIVADIRKELSQRRLAKMGEEERRRVLEEDERRRQEEKRAKQRALDKQRLAERARAKYQEEQLEALRAAQAAAVAREEHEAQMEIHKERVRYRKTLEQEKIREREVREEEREEERREQMMRLEQLKTRIPNYERVQAIGVDTERLTQDTAAFKSAVEATVIPRMFQQTGFSDREVFKDIRMQISAALSRAGLQKTAYARQVLGSMGRPAPRAMASTQMQSVFGGN